MKKIERHQREEKEKEKDEAAEEEQVGAAACRQRVPGGTWHGGGRPP